MRVLAQVFSAVLLAGMMAAQSAPASQTVQSNPQSQPSKTQNAINSVKGALKKNPFAPKAKAPQPASQATSKPQAAAKQQAAAKPQASTPAKQAAPSQAKATAPAKPASPATAKAAVKPKQSAPSQAKVAAKTKQTAPVAAKAAPKPKEVAPAKKVESAPIVAQSTPAKLPNPGKRDPFLSPIAAAAARGPAANCSTGKRCLVVDQIALKGVVQTKAGNIAMVENPAKRSYYLHENDALFDGSVIKITSDSVTFRQESNDIIGRPVSKEVVKKVSAPAV